jgi:hydroxymethylpyrimidine pyrophosphatase-like HAD family hydrolase
MIRVIALDIDGTLLDSQGRLPGRNIDAVARAIEAGVEVVLATGRRYDFARAVFEQLPGPLTLILSNGAIVKTAAGETLHRHLLPREVARTVLAAAPEHRGRAALLFDRPREGQIVYERVDWDHPLHRRFFQSNREFISLVEPLEDALIEDPMQVMFTGGCSEMRELFEALRGGAGLPECGTPPLAVVGNTADLYSVALTEYAHRDFSLVDIIRAGCSKGAALREWCGRRGFDPGEVMAIGDNLNDLQMLEFAGHPVVMGNALEELRTRGWRVTAANDEGGVAVAIDEILSLPRRVLPLTDSR